MIGTAPRMPETGPSMSAINTPYGAGAVDAAVLHAVESPRYVVKIRESRTAED
jgi:hypothetical protein